MCALLQAAHSLISSASEIVYGMYNKQILRLDNLTTCRPVEIDSDFEQLEFE